MKKLITKTIISTITIVYILMTIMANNVKAKDAEKEISMKVESSNSVKIGEEIKIKISLNKNEKGIVGIQGKLNYDRNAFEIVNKEVKQDKWFLSAFNEENGMFMVEILDDAFYDKNSYIYDDDEIVEITLKAKQETKVKKSEISVSETKVVDSDYQTLDIEKVSKTVKIKGNGLSTTSKIVIIIAVVIILVLVIYVVKLKKKKK